MALSVQHFNIKELMEFYRIVFAKRLAYSICWFILFLTVKLKKKKKHKHISAGNQ